MAISSMWDIPVESSANSLLTAICERTSKTAISGFNTARQSRNFFTVARSATSTSITSAPKTSRKRAKRRTRTVCIMVVLIQFDDVLTTVRRIADEPLARRIDDKIHRFQRNLADQHGTLIGHFCDVAWAVSALDG